MPLYAPKTRRSKPHKPKSNNHDMMSN